MSTEIKSTNQPGPVYIALGSNKGDRRAHLDVAVRRLSMLGTEPVIVSSYRETAPIDMADDSGPFLNAAVCLTSSLEPLELLQALQDIEAAMGRPSTHAHHVARTIDLDLIAVGDIVYSDERLVLPHPRAHLRVFVLEPLAEIAPDLRLPGQTLTVAHLLGAIGSPST
ncbi:MAG: 2-amino-4-hydroxy-6-hydroxymethyldihydropteridine diphosphokinase [Pseudomonadota bacterium]